MGTKIPKGSPEGGPSSVFQVKHVLILALILFVVFFGIRKRISSIEQSAKTLPEKVSETAPVILDNKATDGFSKEAYEREMIANRKQAYANSVLGLKTLPLVKSKGKVNIPFEFIPQKVWCQGGDIDTIRYATSKSSAKEVLISLESMDSNKVGEVLKVSVDTLISGFSHTFRVPGDFKEKSLQLSICTDRKKSGSCKKAQIVDQATLNKTLGASSNQTDKDYLFYFQHLVYSGNSVQTYSSDVFDAKFKKKISAFLDKSSVGKNEIDKAWKLNKTIKSNPVEIIKGKIVLSLPYNDPRCMPGN